MWKGLGVGWGWGVGHTMDSLQSNFLFDTRKNVGAKYV